MRDKVIIEEFQMSQRRLGAQDQGRGRAWRGMRIMQNFASFADVKN